MPPRKRSAKAPSSQDRTEQTTVITGKDETAWTLLPGPMVAGLSALLILFILWTSVQSSHNSLTVSCAFACAAGLATYRLIPALADSFVQAGLVGKDLNKADTPLLPESMGFLCATVYVVALFLFIPFPFMEWFSGTGRLVHSEIVSPPTFPYEKLGGFLSALLSLQSMIVLGFADDVFNIRWRYKLFLPTVASIPLLMVYYVNFGITSVVVPIPLRSLLGRILDLGPLYYVYMSMMAVFCTNSINILAGVNGVEAGQSLVIALSIIVNDILFLGSRDPTTLEVHLFSLYLMVPFAGVTCGLLYHNWFPARVFVGDTYCYFAGMIFAVVGILGHFSKTMLLFFIPQIFNFLYSVPQLFHFVECPRHRMPRFHPDLQLLVPSVSPLKRVSTPGRLFLHLFNALGLLSAQRNEHGDYIQVNNLTLINLLLVKFGPMSERRLATMVLMCQILCSGIAFIIRYRLVHWVYDLAA